MTPEADTLRKEITQWCIAHKVDPNYQAHMNYDVRSRIVDSWVLSHAGLLLIPEPTDGTAYFMDNSSNQVVIRQSMTTNPLELFHRMAIIPWSGLIGDNLPSRNLKRDFYMITKLDDQGQPKPYGWTPSLVSHFPDFGAFGYEAILDNLFTGYLSTSHAHIQPLRASFPEITVNPGVPASVQLRVKGGTPPYDFLIGPDPFGTSIAQVDSAGLVTFTVPAAANAGVDYPLIVLVADSEGMQTHTTITLFIRRQQR